MANRLLEVDATITKEELKRLRQKRSLQGWISAGLVLAMVWVLSGVSLAPSALDYGSTTVGIGSKSMPVQLTNGSSSEIHPVIGLEGKSASDFRVDAGPCASVASGESCVLVVEFRPQEPGEKSARLTANLSGDETLGTELAGTATPAAVLVSPGVLDFREASVGATSVQSVTLQSEGWFHIHGLSLEGEGRSQYSTTTEPCTENRTDLNQCAIAVQFRPNAPGTWTAELVISDDGLQSPHRVRLRGIGSSAGLPPLAPPVLAPQPAIRIDPLKLNFSSQTNQTQEVHLWNEGNGSLHITASLQGADRDRFEIGHGGCGAEIRAHDKCSITVYYRPKIFTLKASYSAVLQIDHDAANIVSPQSVALSWERIVTPPPQVTPHATPQVTPQPQTPQSVTLTINMLADPSCSPSSPDSSVSSRVRDCRMIDKSCSANVEKGTSITLTAKPGDLTRFNSFSGDCKSTQPSCTLTMTDNLVVTASFCGLIL